MVASHLKLEYLKEDEASAIARFTPQSMFWKIVSQFENAQNYE